MTLIPPTVIISETGDELIVDGVKMIFQVAPDSEAPAEFHFLLPDFRALCMAENATHVQHNILTIRGALVRDPHAWARYITDAIELFGDQSWVDVVARRRRRGKERPPNRHDLSAALTVQGNPGATRAPQPPRG